MELLNVMFFGFFNLFLVVRGLKKDMGIFSFTALAGCTNLSFVFPQLIAIYNSPMKVLGYMDVPLIAINSSIVACWLGFKFTELLPKHSKGYTVSFIPSRAVVIILLFSIVGVVAYFMNRGVYKGGSPSGTFVVINFFVGFITYALIVALIEVTRRHTIYNKLIFVIIGLLLFIGLDQLVQQARRAGAIFYCITILYFICENTSYRKYSMLKYVLPTFFFLGTIFNTNIGQYRSNAWNDKSVSDNFESLDFSTWSEAVTSLDDGELNNAFVGINYCYLIGEYDYGVFNWNTLVRQTVPKAIVGEEAKQAMLVKTEYSSLTRNLTASGMTMTGYFDAFASFGFFGFIKFGLIGFIMGLIWRGRLYSERMLVLYLSMITPALHLFTHSSGYFVCSYVLFLVMAYPFILFASRKEFY